MALIDNIQAYWKLADLTDEDGNTYPLTNVGTCTFGSGGIFGDCVTVPSGTNKFLGRTDNCGTTATGAWSVSMWVKMASETSTDREMFQNYVVGGSGAVYRGLYEYNGGSRRVRFFRIGSGPSFLDVTGNIANNAWHHIVYTYDGTNQTLYVDNGTGVTDANTGTTSIGAAEFNLGGGTSNTSLNGLMDEVGLWTRELTSAEVSELYNGGAGLQYPFSSTNSGFFNLM